MSYSFSGTNNRMVGTLTTPISMPYSFGIWFKITDHPIAQRCMAMLGNAAASVLDSASLRLTAVDNQFEFTNRDQVNTREVAVIRNRDNLWTPLLGVNTRFNWRFVYMTDVDTHSSVGPGSALLPSMANLILGENLANAQDFAGLLAHFSIWDGGLSDTGARLFLRGLRPSLIHPTHLRAYYPLTSENTTQANEGLDAGGDLTVTGATFSTDDPLIYDVLPPELHFAESNVRFG